MILNNLVEKIIFASNVLIIYICKLNKCPCVRVRVCVFVSGVQLQVVMDQATSLETMLHTAGESLPS